MSTPQKSKFELAVELTKVLVWPLLVVVLVLSFWGPLHKVAELAPSIIGRSDSISIAGLSLKLTPRLKNKATPDVERAIARISKDSIERVLALADSTSWDINSTETGKREFKDLVKAGLVVEVPQQELELENRNHGRTDGYMVRSTDLGKRTQSFLRAVIAEVVQEIASEASSVN